MLKNPKYCAIFLGNSEESTMLTEQSVWYGSASSPTPNENLLSEEI